MIKNVIRHNEKIYIVDRELPSSTTEESANRIHNVLGTDALLRNQQGIWFCCKVAKEVEFRDVSHPGITPPPPEDHGHYGFELQDNGGMG
jgi:hypothetical protein